MSSEYGWSHDQIMDLPLCTLRQTSIAITKRKYREQKANKRLISWQTRTLATYIAATIPTEKGRSNGLLKQAQQIVLDDLELEEMGVAGMDDPDTRSIEEVVEHGSATAEKRNKVGSFERFLSGT